jgi:hypothetical protein
LEATIPTRKKAGKNTCREREREREVSELHTIPNVDWDEESVNPTTHTVHE